MSASDDLLSCAIRIIMAAEGKDIIFYRCNLFIDFFVSIDERPVIGSQPDLASRSEVLSTYKCPQKFRGLFPKFGAQKTSNFLSLFSPISVLNTTYLRKETSHRQTKMLVSIKNVSPKS